MAQHNEFGKWGEEVATDYLLQIGYKLLARNYRYYKAEIDIIALHNDVLIIVEVKTRSHTYFGNPEETIDRKKENLLSAAAWAFAQANDWQGPIRFDIVAIVGTPEVNAEIRHYRDAFYPMDDDDSTATL